MRDTILRRKATLQKRVDAINGAASEKCKQVMANAEAKAEPILAEIAKLDELLVVYEKEPAASDGVEES